MKPPVFVSFKNGVIEAEVADSVVTHSIGLMGREALSGHQGMLFVFPHNLRTVFWTFGMRFAIDIIFLNKEKKVTEIHRNCIPWRSFILPKHKFRSALEVHAGTTDRLLIHVGDEAEF